jgi:hypothetical protein
MVFPQRFRLADRSLLGLSMTDYYVVPEARPSGLMRSVLDLDDADFFFSTTANAAGGGAMRKLGAVAVPGWDCEHILPLHLGPLMEGYLQRWNATHWAKRIARRVGTISDYIRPRPWRASSSLELRPTTDWELLATISERLRKPGLTTPRRATEDLRWRFEQAPSAGSIQVFALEGGTATGWLATHSYMRGTGQPVRCRAVLDHVFSEDAEPAEVLLALAHRAEEDTDLITLAGPEGYWSVAGLPWLLRRRFDVPRAFVIGPSSDPALAETIELTLAIGDNFA